MDCNLNDHFATLRVERCGWREARGATDFTKPGGKVVYRGTGVSEAVHLTDVGAGAELSLKSSQGR